MKRLEKPQPKFRPRVGDVITCVAFADGWKDPAVGRADRKDIIYVSDNKADPYPRCRKNTDQSRAKALYIVEESRTSEERISWRNTERFGHEGDFERDVEHHEHGWLIIARRLRSNGTYNPKGKLILYINYSERDAIKEADFTTWCAHMTICHTLPYIIGKMQRTVNFE